MTPWTVWNSPGQNTRVGSLSLLRDLPNPGIKPRSPALQADCLPAEPQGTPTVYQSLIKFMSIELVMIYNHVILCHSLLLLPSLFTRTGVFSNVISLNIILIHYILIDIMMIRQIKVEVANMLEALGRLMCSRRWKENSMKI